MIWHTKLSITIHSVGAARRKEATWWWHHGGDTRFIKVQHPDGGPESGEWVLHQMVSYTGQVKRNPRGTPYCQAVILLSNLGGGYVLRRWRILSTGAKCPWILAVVGGMGCSKFARAGVRGGAIPGRAARNIHNHLHGAITAWGFWAWRWRKRMSVRADSAKATRHMHLSFNATSNSPNTIWAAYNTQGATVADETISEHRVSCTVAMLDFPLCWVFIHGGLSAGAPDWVAL